MGTWRRNAWIGWTLAFAILALGGVSGYTLLSQEVADAFLCMHRDISLVNLAQTIKIDVLEQRGHEKDYLLSFGQPEAQLRCLQGLSRTSETLRSKIAVINTLAQTNPRLTREVKSQTESLAALYENYCQGFQQVLTQISFAPDLSPQKAHDLLSRHQQTGHNLEAVLDRIATAGEEHVGRPQNHQRQTSQDYASGQYLTQTQRLVQDQGRPREHRTLLENGALPAATSLFSKLFQSPDHAFAPAPDIPYVEAVVWPVGVNNQGNHIDTAISRLQSYYLVTGLVGLIFIMGFVRWGVGPLRSAWPGANRRPDETAMAVIGLGPAGTLLPSGDGLKVTAPLIAPGAPDSEFISNTLRRYIDPEIAQELVRRPEISRLGGDRREVIILFADLRDFTPWAESISPEIAVTLLNQHFARMVEVLKGHHAIIVDFYGDGILAFVDPGAGEIRPALRQALECALKMQAAVAEMHAVHPEGLPLMMGIGLHVGDVVVGNIGSETRAKYGIVGAAVNLANRLQAMAQGGEVVVSDAVCKCLGEELLTLKTMQAELKGIRQPVTIHVVAGLAQMPGKMQLISPPADKDSLFK